VNKNNLTGANRWKQASANANRYCATLIIGEASPELGSCNAGNVNAFTYT